MPQLSSALLGRSVTVIDADQRPPLVAWSEVWQFRNLLGLLAWRDVRVRYSQTLLGVGWAITEPLVSVALFTLLFNRLAGIDIKGHSYVLCCAAGMLVWTYFGRAVRNTTLSLVSNAGLATKSYFPRLILPLAAQATALIDLLFAIVAYCALLLAFMHVPGPGLITLPIWIGLATISGLGTGLLLTAINVRYRDVSQAVPFMLQVWMFASPVVYPLSMVPEGLRVAYCLNPMVAAVEGARAALVPGYAMELWIVGPGLLSAVAMLWIGLAVFRSVERQFADIV